MAEPEPSRPSLLPRRRAKEQAPLAINAQLELQRLEQEFGGRQHLVQALTFAKQTKDVRYLLGLIADPEHNALSLAEVCRMGRILPGELLDALASGTELRSRLLAKQAIARRVPSVVSEVMHKAAEYEDDCTECMGTGAITADPTREVPNPEPQPCILCRGGGKLRFPADGKCRDLALEMAGLVGQGGGVHVNTSVQVAQVAGSSYEGFERMQEAMDAVLYGAAAGLPTIDAEPIPDTTRVPPEEGADVPPAEAP